MQGKELQKGFRTETVIAKTEAHKKLQGELGKAGRKDLAKVSTGEGGLGGGKEANRQRAAKGGRVPVRSEGTFKNGFHILEVYHSTRYSEGEEISRVEAKDTLKSTKRIEGTQLSFKAEGS